MNRLPILRTAALMTALVIAACSTTQGRVERAPVPAEPLPSAPLPPLNPLPAPAPPTVTLPPARNYPRSLQDSGAGAGVITLCRQAQDARSGGQPDQALALLERAIRIEPRNPFVWQALAATQMDLKAWDQAESAASKSNSLGRGNPYVEVANWRLIATARQAAGDDPGALTARARADDAAARIAAP